MWTFLYVSDLSPDHGPDVVATIAAESIPRNARDDITGLLIFEQRRFAQILEGPTVPTLALLERLRQDPRHERIDLLHSGPLARPRRFPNWRVGYLLFDLQEFDVASLRGQRGAAAMASFEFMLPALDFQLAEDIPSRLGRKPPGGA